MLLSSFQVQRYLQIIHFTSLRHYVEQYHPVLAFSRNKFIRFFQTAVTSVVFPSKKDSRVLMLICGQKQKSHKLLIGLINPS